MQYWPICVRIFELLDSLPITQKEFANAISVSPQTITDWKKGKSQSYLHKLPVIAGALGTTPEWLFTGRGNKSLLNERNEMLEEMRLKEDIQQKKEAVRDISPASEDTIKAAFWGGDKDLSAEDMDAMWADVKNFAAFVAQRKKQEKKRDE